ncbi:hypothetical protein AB0C21_28925 [Spirillospora sp. NPDC049024]
MIPVKAILVGVSIAFLATLVLIVLIAFAQDPESEPGPVLTALSWVLGAVVRACSGYVAARMSVRTGSRGLVVGAGAIAGAMGYALFLSLMATFAALGGHPGFSVGDVVGLPVWAAQAAVGGVLAVVLHRKRIATEAQNATWAYG